MSFYENHRGDFLAVAPGLPAASFDGCLTDPPYGLTFMGKAWDHGVPGPEYWREVLRLLKPGAALLAFGGTRTFHRLTCAIEDAGFEVRNCLLWLYGQGFPKSLNFGRELGGEWSGYGTALKPAWEPIVLARRPCETSFADSAVKYGVAGFNVGGCRLGTEVRVNAAPAHSDSDDWSGNWPARPASEVVGRWPANVLLDETAAELLDRQTGILTSGKATLGSGGGTRNGRVYSGPTTGTIASCYADSGGASRFFYVAKASSSERDEGLAEFPLSTADPYAQHRGRRMPDGSERIDGKPARQGKNVHPTVKPLDLCRYLATLILPPPRGDGQEPRRLLVPFSGSGSEMIGAYRAGWDRVVGIERETEYANIAEGRLAGEVDKAGLFLGGES